MVLNALDGMLATKYNLQSNTGAYLNEICDVISDFFLYLPFVQFNFIPTFGIVILICLSLISEFSGLALVIGGEKRSFKGPFGKSDRAFFFSFLSFMIAFDIHVESYYQSLIFFGIFLSVLTTWNRGSSLLDKSRAE